MGMFDRDRDGRELDDIAGVIGGIGNVAGGTLGLGDQPDRRDTIGERFRHMPDDIAESYRRGSQAGNQLGDDVGAWWDDL